MESWIGITIKCHLQNTKIDTYLIACMKAYLEISMQCKLYLLQTAEGCATQWDKYCIYRDEFHNLS